MKVIMDSDSLIKLARAKVKEIVVENIDAYIPPKVLEETVTLPKKEGFPDAFLIEENLDKGLLSIGEIKEDQHIEEMVTSLGMGYGEADVFRLYKSGGFDAMSYLNNLKEMVSDEEYYLAIKEVE